MTKGRLTKLPSRLSPLPPRIAVPAKQADPIYSTPEYHRWRGIVLKRAAGHCQDPQHQGPNPWPGRLIPDHIKELKDGGGPFDPANGMARCDPCHTRKTNDEREKRTAASL